MDNDIYGHVNNAVYYSYFDAVANQYLIEKGGLDVHKTKQFKNKTSWLVLTQKQSIHYENFSK